MKNPLDNLLTTRQLAASVGCSRQTVMAHLKAGKITPEFTLEGPTGTHYFSKATANRMKVAMKSRRGVWGTTSKSRGD